MQRFLVSRLSSLGDVVCTLPVASALKAGHPECEVVWAVDPRFAGIVECCSAVDKVAKVKPGFSPSTWPRFEETFEGALDMQGLSKSAIVIAMAKAKHKLGYHWQREGAWLFSRAVVPDVSSWHIVDQYVDVARAIGGQADAAVFSLHPKPEDLETVRGKLSAKGVSSRFLAINAGAGWATKRWPPGHFAELINELQGEGLPCVLIGGKAEADRQAFAEVAELCEVEPMSMLGETSVRELVALLSLADLHIGGDTGSTHIMAALGRPAIGLYSITRPRRSCPYGQIDRCLYDPGSLANISPRAVLERVKEVLD